MAGCRPTRPSSTCAISPSESYRSCNATLPSLAPPSRPSIRANRETTFSFRRDAPVVGTRQRSNDLILQFRVAAPQAVEILEQNIEHVILVAPRLAGSMRRDQHV